MNAFEKKKKTKEKAFNKVFQLKHYMVKDKAMSGVCAHELVLSD